MAPALSFVRPSQAARAGERCGADRGFGWTDCIGRRGARPVLEASLKMTRQGLIPSGLASNRSAWAGELRCSQRAPQ